MDPSCIILLQKRKINENECATIMEQMSKDEYITIIDKSYDYTIFYNPLCEYISKITNDSKALTVTFKGDMYLENCFIEKYSNPEYKQLVDVNYKNKTHNFIIGIVLLETNNNECILTIFNRDYKLENGDIIWFPASWCYPFSEKYGEGTCSLKLIINKFL